MAPTTLTIDLDRGDAGSGFKLLPAGLYKLRITKCDIKDGPAGPYLNLQLTDERSKQSLWTIVSTSQAARFKMNEFLDALALPGKGKLKTTELPGKYIWAEVTQASYTAKPKGDQTVGTTKLKNEVERFVGPKEAEQLVALNPSSEADPNAVNWFDQLPGADDDDEEEVEQAPLDPDDIPF